MIQVIRENGIWTSYGLSEDDKDDMLKFASASSFHPLIFKELDTGKTYYYDPATESWPEWGTAPSEQEVPEI